MPKKIIGIALIALGGIGYIFFNHYTGELIPYPFACWLASIALAGIGFLLLFISPGGTKKERSAISRIEDQIALLKAKGEKILLDYDLCEFKSSDYHEEIQDESRARSYDVLLNQQTTIETRHIMSTRLVYNNKSGARAERFISQPFPVNEISLKASVLNGQAWLYVDRFDRKKYYFEIK